MSIQTKYNKSKKDLKLKQNSKSQSIKLNDTKKIESNQSKIDDVNNIVQEKQTDQTCDIDNLNKVPEEETTLKTNDVELKNDQENDQPNSNEEESFNKATLYISNEEINPDHFASHTNDEINSDNPVPNTSDGIHSDHFASHDNDETNCNEEKESEMDDQMDIHKNNDELTKKTDEPLPNEQIDSETANKPVDINPVKDA